MPPWIIELFGQVYLNWGFWFINLMTAPLWGLLIFAQRSRRIKKIFNPYWSPFLLVGILLYLYYILIVVGGPGIPDGFDYSAGKSLIMHPVVFLIVLCEMQILHWIIGLYVFQDAQKRKMRVTFELIGIWLFGPLGYALFVIRIFFRRR